MAVCETCGENMKQADGCTEDRVIIGDDGEVYEPIPYAEEQRWDFIEDFDPPSGDDRCHDCEAKVGTYHHPGCDMEECPICGRQYFACGCGTNDDESRLLRKEWYDPDNPAESIAKARREQSGDVVGTDEFRADDESE